MQYKNIFNHCVIYGTMSMVGNLIITKKLKFQDVNDEVPKFEADSLVANIEENCPYKTSLTIVGANTLTHVSDLDQENICQ